MEQLTLFPEPTEYSADCLYSTFDDTQFDWHNCFSAFVNFNYWTPNSFGIVADYREIFWKLNRVCIAEYVLDGLIPGYSKILKS